MSTGCIVATVAQTLSHVQFFAIPWTQHTRLPCPPSPRACSDSGPFSQWCHPIISFSIIPLSSCLQSFPASGSFPMSRHFTSGGQSRSFSFSISLSNEYSGLISFRSDWLDLLQFKGLSRAFSTVQKHQFFSTQLSSQSNSHILTWLWEKPCLWLDGPLLAKQCLCFLICCLGWSHLFFQRASIF